MFDIAKCNRCGKEKLRLAIYFPVRGKYLLRTCRECWRVYESEYMKKRGKAYCKAHSRRKYENNREKIIEAVKSAYRKNREKVIKQKKEYKQRKKIEYQINYRRRYKNSPRMRIDASVASLIRRSIKDKQNRSWQSLVGYSIEDLLQHLRTKFQDGMSYDNYGKWHIDHIIPRSHFNYTSCEDVAFKECWNLNNLQPLWAKDNIRKRDKTNG